MKKKILVIIISTAIIISLFLLFQYTIYNLKSNSVYYAKNMPRGEEQYPEIIMLVENMEWLYRPDIKSIRYRSKGNNSITNYYTNERISNIYSDVHKYIYTSRENITYIFTKNIDFTYISDSEYIELDIEKVDKKEVMYRVKQFLSPIIEAQPKPKVNLQWLFNFIYEDDFK